MSSSVIDGLSSGPYEMQFDFYSKTDYTGELLYSFTESVNVLPNLETSTWVQNGASPWLQTTTDDSGNTSTICHITKELVDNFRLRNIYVDPTATITSESGTQLNPCRTFSKAIEKLNDADTDYTIYIKGTLNGAQTIPASLSKNGADTTKSNYAKSLTICGASGLDDTGEPQNSINGNFTGAQQGTPLTLETDVPVTIRNLWIKGGNQTNKNGGGLVVKAGAKVTLDKGVVISNNVVCNTGYNENGGAGVYVAPASGENPAGVLIVKGAVIKQNNAGGMGSLKYGGGIFNEGNTYIYGTSVIGGTNSGEGNSAENGGGIYNTGCLYLGITENGENAAWTGGIYGNEAVYCGGGIYNKSKSSTTGIVKMRSGAISKNVCTFDPSNPAEGEQIGGGGIYCEGKDSSGLAKVFLYGDAVIGDSTATSVADESNCSNKALNGAGVHLNCYSHVYLGYKSETETALYNKGIYYNYASASTGEYGPGGGGIYCESTHNSILISSGTIANNKSESDGGGIRDLSNSDLTFYGGTIKQNRCGISKKGGQICKEIGKIRVKGNAAAEGDAYVYCDSVQVDGALTPVSQNGLTAILEPTDYENFTITFGSPLDPATTPAAARSKFGIAPKNDRNWIFNSSGRLISCIGTKFDYAFDDIVFNDGSAIPYSESLTLTSTQKNAAIAYIVTKFNSKFIGIGLKQIQSRIANSTSLAGYGNIGATGLNDGKTNTEAYKSLSDYSETNYPAIYWALNYKNSATNLGSYKTDWYIPSQLELEQIASKFDSINAAFAKIGTSATVLTKGNEYVSSTEKTSGGYTKNYCNTMNGSTKQIAKDSRTYYRVVRQFD